MNEQNKSKDIFSLFKDIRQTGTQELSKSVRGGAIAPWSTAVSQDAAAALATPTPSPGKATSDQISVGQEKWERDIIEARV